MNSYAYPTFPAEADRLHAQAEPAYWPDIANEVDKPWDTLAEELGTTPDFAKKVIQYAERQVQISKAITLGRVVGLLIESNSHPIVTHAIACAAGLDQLNGAKSQAEVAREHGVTRSLVSHYVVGVRDLLSGKTNRFDCTKFRKSNESRKIFQEKATSPFLAAKRAAIERIKQQQTQQHHATN